MLGLACLTQVAGCHLLFRYFDRREILPADPAHPGGRLPVLVLTPAAAGPGHQAHLVYADDLADFLKQHPTHTFLVPQSEEAALREQVRHASRPGGASGERMQGPFFFDFEVIKRASDSQELVVDGSDDDWRMKGWYRARDRSYQPQRKQAYFGPGSAIGSTIMSAFANGLAWLLILVVTVVVRKHRAA